MIIRRSIPLVLFLSVLTQSAWSNDLPDWQVVMLDAVQKNRADARTIYEKSLQLWQSTDAANSDGASIYLCLGDLSFQESKLNSAIFSYKQALAVVEKLKGPKSPALIPALNRLSVVLGARGKAAEGAAYANRAIQIKRTVFGSDDFTMLIEYRGGILTSLEESGNYKDGERVARDMLACMMKMPGWRDNENVPVAMKELAKCLWFQGKKAEALAEIEAAFEASKRVRANELSRVAVAIDYVCLAKLSGMNCSAQEKNLVAATNDPSRPLTQRRNIKYIMEAALKVYKVDSADFFRRK